LKRTQQVVELIEMHFTFNLIDANGTLQQTERKVLNEISSEMNGQLLNDASLSKALSPQMRRKSNRSFNRTPRNNSFRRDFRSTSNLAVGSPRFTLQPKPASPPQFQNNLNCDLTPHSNT
jgi:hypothetical protein